MIESSDNRIAEIASKYINSTNRHIFLTGRAGTGKTTFLRDIVTFTHKKVVVAAPTGIAAINAGGITLHSLFHLPFGTFIPDNNYNDSGDRSIQLNTPRSLISSIKMNTSKRQLIREMELLIIDEVSMLRADLLDAIDTILRYVRRKNNVPFGGVQMLFIGDLLQLPPVVKSEEKNYLRSYYRGVYFFESKALQNNTPIYIELDKIYRQTDLSFISILNNLRDNKTTQADIEILNKQYSPTLESGVKDGYIFITTHNHKAENINRQELNKLKEKSYSYDAEVKGDFNDYSYPIEYTLELKKGVQVMFIKNDPSPERLYFNGKIGKVSKLDKDSVEVSFEDGTENVYVEKYIWENKRYSLNKENNEIDEKIMGTFSHFPLKLAWAITVHKSQGLTFEKAIIDVSGAFAPGQIYVALSRLTSLNGLLLNEPISTKGMDQDIAVKEFAEEKLDSEVLQTRLKTDSQAYIKDVVLESFDFSVMKRQFYYHLESYSKDVKKSAKQKYLAWAKDLNVEVIKVKEVADKFQAELKHIFYTHDEGYLLKLNQRIKAAVEYFEPLLKDLSHSVFSHISNVESEKGVKKYCKELADVELLFFKQLITIQKIKGLVKALIEDTEFSKETLNRTTSLKDREVELSSKSSGRKKEAGKKIPKEKKANTKEISYALYCEGWDVGAIAAERSFAVSTIEGHLAYYVSIGKIDVQKFISKLKLQQILKVSELLDTEKLGAIMEKLGDEFTYNDIKFAIAHKDFQRFRDD